MRIHKIQKTKKEHKKIKTKYPICSFFHFEKPTKIHNNRIFILTNKIKKKKENFFNQQNIN